MTHTMNTVVTTIITTMTSGTTLSHGADPGSICRGIAIQRKFATRVKVRVKAGVKAKVKAKARVKARDRRTRTIGIKRAGEMTACHILNYITAA